MYSIDQNLNTYLFGIGVLWEEVGNVFGDGERGVENLVPVDRNLVLDVENL